MPYPGYMEDLSLLIEDCLIPLNPYGSEPELTSEQNSQGSRVPPPNEISSSTLEALLLLDGLTLETDSNEADEAEKCNPTPHQPHLDRRESLSLSSNSTSVSSAAIDTAISTTKYQIESYATLAGPRSPPRLEVNSANRNWSQASELPHQKQPFSLNSLLVKEETKTSRRAGETTATEVKSSALLPAVKNMRDTSGSRITCTSSQVDSMGSLQSEVSHSTFPADRLMPAEVPHYSQPQSIVFPKKVSDRPQTQPLSSSSSTIASTEKSTPSTVSTVRSTDAVISDLSHHRSTSIHPASRREQGSVSGASFGTSSESIKQSSSTVQKAQGSDIFNREDGVEEEREDGVDEEREDGVEEESEDEIGPITQPGKITERKRRLNALADLHIQSVNLEDIKSGAVVQSREEAQQSTRWLVSQSEDRDIISSPREYQIELFQRAIEKNVIAVLDTGSGKTLIAVLLLRHIFAQELEARALGEAKRVSFFLVDSVTLLFQQHAVLKANLDQPMDVFCGDMGCDLWSKALWEEHFDKNMAIVCTAEVLRQCLHHSFISMDRINILIFDEAHHAKKDHTYARIIKDFYAQTPIESLRPKIFGMTASPVDARVDVRKAAAELEGILHAEICTTDDPDLMKYAVTMKQEKIARYAPLGPKFETPLYHQMYERFGKNIVMYKPLKFAYEASRDLGAWCSDELWSFCLGEQETRKLQAKTERSYRARKVPGPIEILEQHNSQLEEARDIIKAHEFVPPDYNKNSQLSINLSSKVLLLVHYLKERFERPTDDKCIIFVRQRYTARLLAKLLSHSSIRTPHLFVGALVGTRTGDAGDLNVSFREQVLTMINFRKGSLNCLIATSVAEEGLDIPDCNLIIRFDLYSTLIQYIQSRGRARHANSRYIHMIEDNNQEHNNLVVEVRRNEKILKAFCAALPADRKLTGNDFNMNYFLAKERRHRVYTVPSTQAKLTYKMSLLILSNFVDSLQHGPDGSRQAEYVIIPQGKVFLCEVILPEASPIRSATGREASTKQVAKCSAAFEACLELIKGKYLDENLLPTFTKQLPAMRNALLAVNSKKQEAYKMKTKPDLWSMGGEAEELYLTALVLENPESISRASQPLALLTRHKLPRLPSFKLFFGAGKNSSVICLALNRILPVNAEIIRQFNNFTLCIFADVFSKEYEPDVSSMPYFLAPISSTSDIYEDANPSDLIAWDILSSVEREKSKFASSQENNYWQTEPDEFFIGKFIADPFDGSRKLWIIGVAPEYKPLDPVPPNSAPRKGTRKNNDNILEYSCSLWAKARSKVVLDPTQRVFEAKLISLRRNLLDEFEDVGPQSPQKCFIVLEFLIISALPAPVVMMAYLFPAIIHRIESYLIALEAVKLLHLDIRPDLALEAVTKDSDNSDEHDSEQINFQRGMGNNYERLEFLGDCFLKMATSISLYGLHPDNDEYRYHVDRMLLICNKNLSNNAVKMRLYEYIRSQSFNRRAWYPDGLVLKKGKRVAAPDVHRLGEKTIADVCEAMIGAALLSSYGSGNLDNAVRAVSEMVCSENHNITTWSGYYKLYTKPKFQVDVATQMQINLAAQVEQKHAYHFKHPRLLRSAFIHPSYPFAYEHIPSYQRLEFLGDALLDMVCVNHLFHNFPGKDPQWLTEHKMAMVSNQFLGALCVSLKFNAHLLAFTDQIQKHIKDYVDEIEEARLQAEEDAVRAGRPASEYARDFWISVRHPPKCLPDIVEAYIGAIFVDSEYDLGEVERFFDLHIKHFFLNMEIYDTYANKQPTTFLTNFLQVSMGCQDWSVLSRERKTIDGSKPTVLAMVYVHEQLLAEFEAESGKYAKIGAAKKAMAVLGGLGLPEFRDKYRCECKDAAAEGEDVDGSVAAAVKELHGTAI